uniref:Uncharacterized protein n=1 Tax=Eutreptiella gymnastica TaxID=73025 RepID=A0A7S1NM74_9EUGL|mmetsp:Transcript_5764/g.10304  ORF Transcript_5764/g.10304 Transcript_5764/m.10304 type:complete len:274 (+) Transcript_5764:109-930(+)
MRSGTLGMRSYANDPVPLCTTWATGGFRHIDIALSTPPPHGNIAGLVRPVQRKQRIDTLKSAARLHAHRPSSRCRACSAPPGHPPADEAGQKRVKKMTAGEQKLVLNRLTAPPKAAEEEEKSDLGEAHRRLHKKFTRGKQTNSLQRMYYEAMDRKAAEHQKLDDKWYPQQSKDEIYYVDFESSIHQLYDKPKETAQAKQNWLEDKYLQPLVPKTVIGPKAIDASVSRLYTEYVEQERLNFKLLFSRHNMSRPRKQLTAAEVAAMMDRMGCNDL